MIAVAYEECKCHNCVKWRNYASALHDSNTTESMKLHIEGMFSTENPHLPRNIRWQQKPKPTPQEPNTP